VVFSAVLTSYDIDSTYLPVIRQLEAPPRLVHAALIPDWPNVFYQLKIYSSEKNI
jgi:hypothetical protein